MDIVNFLTWGKIQDTEKLRIVRNMITGNRKVGKRMKKRFLALLMALVMCLTLLPVATVSAAQNTNADTQTIELMAQGQPYSDWALSDLLVGDTYGIYPVSWYTKDMTAPITKGKTNNPFKIDFLEQIIKEAYEAIQIALSNSYKRIYFISKSLGTSVAGEMSNLIGYDKINNLFLTPTSHTIPHIINSRCVVVVGSNDKFFSKENIDTISTYSSVDLHIINNAAHSLEVDDNYRESLEILSHVTNLCVSFVCKK
jgi:hypothetical protein